MSLAAYGEARQRALGEGFDPPDFDAFWSAGSYEFKSSAPAPVLLERFREDPDAHALKTLSGRIEIFSETIARFGYDDCPPHPSWLEPAEWLGSAVASRYPIHLLSNQPRFRLHSQRDMAALSRAAKNCGPGADHNQCRGCTRAGHFARGRRSGL
jgi:biotin/methionine sulfoxide reductase